MSEFAPIRGSNSNWRTGSQTLHPFLIRDERRDQTNLTIDDDIKTSRCVMCLVPDDEIGDTALGPLAPQ